MIVSYLSIQEILRLHFQIIEEYGGIHGLRDENRLLSVVQTPKQTIAGNEQYPTIFTKAAIYVKNIIGDHPFTDGNKRTAITVGGIFLYRHGHPIKTSPKKLEDFTIRIATQQLTIEEIGGWFETNSL